METSGFAESYVRVAEGELEIDEKTTERFESLDSPFVPSLEIAEKRRR